MKFTYVQKQLNNKHTLADIIIHSTELGLELDPVGASINAIYEVLDNMKNNNNVKELRELMDIISEDYFTQGE